MQVWIVGQWFESTRWDFQGVFSSRDAAVKACVNENYFLFPAAMDQELPEQTTEAPDCEYPLRGVTDSGATKPLTEIERLRAELVSAKREHATTLYNDYKADVCVFPEAIKNYIEELAPGMFEKLERHSAMVEAKSPRGPSIKQQRDMLRQAVKDLLTGIDVFNQRQVGRPAQPIEGPVVTAARDAYHQCRDCI